MKVYRSIFITAIAFVPVIGLAGEWTVQQNIARVEYDGDADTLWFLGPALWVSPSCPSPTWIRIPSTVGGRKQMLSIGLAAQMAEKKVAFWGTCDSGGTFFNATYMKIE